MRKLWKFISELGFHEGLPSEEVRRLRLLSRLNFIAFDVLLVYLVVELWMGVFAFMPYIAVVEAMLLFDLFLLHKRKYAAAKYFSIITMAGTIVFFALTTGEDVLSDLLLIPLVAMPLVVLKSRKEAFIILGLLIALLLAVKSIQPSFEPWLDLDVEGRIFMSRMNIVIAMFITFMLTFYFRVANEDYEQDILHANAIINERNKEITDSITYAKRIQDAILPPQRVVKEWLQESFILYRPKDIVAGDFYWMPSQAAAKESEQEVVYFAAADCTGHGVPGAMVSVVCSNALSRALVEEGVKEPGKILDRTRELVTDLFGQGDEDIKDGMDISLCALSTSTGTLKWAGANNPLWIIRKNATEVEEIKPDKQPIGKYAAEKPFTTHTIELKTGDAIYIFSDGFQDQFGGDKGKKFKSGKLKKLLISVQELDMQAQRAALLSAFENWKGELEQVDDVCVIGVKYLG